VGELLNRFDILVKLCSWLWRVALFVLQGTEKYIVPFLVSKGSPAASSLIKMIATQLRVAVSMMAPIRLISGLVPYYIHIEFCFIFQNFFHSFQVV